MMGSGDQESDGNKPGAKALQTISEARAKEQCCPQRLRPRTRLASAGSQLPVVPCVST